jgi:raffinose/stachyose/melibiose transport system permease protein
VTTTIHSATGTPTQQAQHHVRPTRTNKLLKMNWIGGTLGWLWLVIVMVPIYWIVITSFKTQANYFVTNTFAPPSHPTLDNYRTVIDNDIFKYFLNSVVVTIGATVPAVIISFMAAYAIVRGIGNRTLRWANNLFLMGLAIPLQAVIIPIYLIIIRLKLYDSLLAIVLPSLAFPLTRPALVTVTIYNGVAIWNGFLLPLVLTQSPEKRTIPLALVNLTGQFGVNFPAIAASVTLTTIPVILVYAIGRRQLLSGLTAGFGK